MKQSKFEIELSWALPNKNIHGYFVCAIQKFVYCVTGLKYK